MPAYAVEETEGDLLHRSLRFSVLKAADERIRFYRSKAVNTAEVEAAVAVLRFGRLTRSELSATVKAVRDALKTCQNRYKER